MILPFVLGLVSGIPLPLLLLYLIYPNLVSLILFHREMLVKIALEFMSKSNTRIHYPENLPKKDLLSHYSFYLIKENGCRVDITHQAGIPYCFAAADLGGKEIVAVDNWDEDKTYVYKAHEAPWYASELTSPIPPDDDDDDDTNASIDKFSVNSDELVKNCTLRQLKNFLGNSEDTDDEEDFDLTALLSGKEDLFPDDTSLPEEDDEDEEKDFPEEEK